MHTLMYFVLCNMEAQKGESETSQVIVMVKGHPGTGKSLTARSLSSKLRWPIIDKDDSRSIMHGPHFSSVDATKLNDASYQVMFRTAATQLACGMSVILDCPFAREDLFHRSKQLATKVGILNQKSLLKRLICDV